MDYTNICEEISKDIECIIKKYFPESDVIGTPSVEIEFGDLFPIRNTINPSPSTNTLKISCTFTK